MKKNGILVKHGQVWTVGKKTQQALKDNNNVDVSNRVEIINTMGGYGLIRARCTETNIQYDIDCRNLGKCLSV